MDQKIKNGIKILVFVGIFIIVFCSLGTVLNPAGFYERWFQHFLASEFYTKKESTVDTIYIGNSCIYTGVSPLEVYDRIGVTGYLISTPAQKMWASYYWMKEAFNYHKPKVIFLEVGEAFSLKNRDDELATRRAIDYMKFGRNKLEMIMDPDFDMSQMEQLTCIFPVLRYHSRWSKLNESDYKKLMMKEQYTYGGFFINKDVKEYKGTFNKKAKQEYKKKLEEKKVSQSVNISQESREKMDKMVELCKQHDCELVLIKIPEPRAWVPEKNQAITDYANSKNIKFIDLNYDESINIDWHTETQDEGNHLNIKGAEKVGQFLSEYIKQNFNLQDHRNDEHYKQWNDMLEKYKKDKETVKQ